MGTSYIKEKISNMQKFPVLFLFKQAKSKREKKKNWAVFLRWCATGGLFLDKNVDVWLHLQWNFQLWHLVCLNVHFVLCVRAPFQVVHLQRDELNRETVYPMHPSSIHGVEDMSTLAELHEAAIMHNLCLRYQKDNIYVSLSQWALCLESVGFFFQRFMRFSFFFFFPLSNRSTNAQIEVGQISNINREGVGVKWDATTKTLFFWLENNVKLEQKLTK